jgi:ubiquinone/menaquinone biosynthesis C-methylase UbiE
MSTITESRVSYIPALSFQSLTPLYDPLLRWVMQERRFKQLVVKQAHIQPNHQVIDLGCGTGTLTLMLKQTYPAANIAGLDIDPTILAIAQHKAASLPIAWVRAAATSLPYADNSCDHVVTSLMLHHLTTLNKQRALTEIFRVLRPDGQLHVVDFGRPTTLYARLTAPVMRYLEEVADNLDGYLAKMFEETGFTLPDEPTTISTIFGDLYLYSLKKPLQNGAHS